jgi:predicted HNH restriction endonuclease
LRDGLANYYQTRCQICGSDNTLLIPTDVSDRYYVEVHHIKGLAESYALREQGLLVGFRVNGLGNLVVLCAHHHALVHHLRPVLHFDRANLFWHNQNGTKFLLNTVTPEHANVLKSAS